jgi:hypothetical protein
MSISIDIAGQRFGRLTAVRQTARSSREPRRNPRWLFRCDDGKEIEADKYHVLSGNTRSCGCLSIEAKVERATIHGHAARNRQTSEYRTWSGMHKRCSNPNDKEYKNYGGRGIRVCERWNEFENFLADLGPKPSPKHEIDRFPNKNGNYDPDNCRWATKIQQANNKRTNHHLTVDGETLTVAEWAREANIHPGALRWRIKAGWHSDWILMPSPGMSYWDG